MEVDRVVVVVDCGVVAAAAAFVAVEETVFVAAFLVDVVPVDGRGVVGDVAAARVVDVLVVLVDVAVAAARGFLCAVVAVAGVVLVVALVAVEVEVDLQAVGLVYTDA